MWDENPATDYVLGYNLYYGFSSRDYIFFINVGNVTEFSFKVGDLQEGIRYYFSVTAWNEYGESDFSNEVDTILY